MVINLLLSLRCDDLGGEVLQLRPYWYIFSGCLSNWNSSCAHSQKVKVSMNNFGIDNNHLNIQFNVADSPLLSHGTLIYVLQLAHSETAHRWTPEGSLESFVLIIGLWSYHERIKQILLTLGSQEWNCFCQVSSVCSATSQGLLAFPHKFVAKASSSAIAKVFHFLDAGFSATCMGFHPCWFALHLHLVVCS